MCTFLHRKVSGGNCLLCLIASYAPELLRDRSNLGALHVASGYITTKNAIWLHTEITVSGWTVEMCAYITQKALKVPSACLQTPLLSEYIALTTFSVLDYFMGLSRFLESLERQYGIANESFSECAVTRLERWQTFTELWGVSYLMMTHKHVLSTNWRA